ncbi:MAG: BREX-4 system phosphatase PglZ [Lachnospiraceae bacterium]|nr:BREX-4 system phosphatase PglZ [Lachnospiraceae bacterium]
MLCSEVESYITTAKGLPFFYAVGDSDYNEILNELRQRGVEVDRVSDFCLKDDKYPDIDDIIDYFRTLDIDCHTNKHVLIGLGEYLALRGATYADKQLHRLKNTTLGTARVILLLRGVSPQVYSLVAEDERLNAQKRVFISSNAMSEISVTSVKYSMDSNVAQGVQGLIRVFEDGAVGNCNIKTMMEFPQSLIPVSSINTAYEAIRRTISDFSLPETLGTEQQWDRLFQETSRRKNSMDAVFEYYGYSDNYDEDLYNNCAGFEYKNWAFFLYLKLNVENIKNEYLRYVVTVTDCYDKLKENILTEIIRISRKDARFATFYADRKKLIRYFPETDMAAFILENDIDPAESIYRYTDCTRMECAKIIEWVATNGYIKEIDSIYPALGLYLKPYIFDCGKHSDEFTEYFRQYRLQKVTNQITPAFLETVEKNAKGLPYTHLETRDSVILRIRDKKNAYLYWIDALGVEYMAYITELVCKKGLSMHTDITYAELPTITSINRNFYEKWAGPLKRKEEALDNIKHKDEGGFVYTDGSAPIHLYSELKVIERAIDFAATELALHHCKSFVIASDHGASRLAVLHKQEEKYETDTKGEHSGRCCKEFSDAELPYAIRENGYLVLADYGRFKKSRAANVEVHGGASLEEVLVPVITLTLKKQSDQIIKLLDPDSIQSDRHAGTTINLYISDVEHSGDVRIVIADKSYAATSKDATHYSVLLDDYKRAKKNVSASIYDGEDLIGNINFEIKGRTATVKNDFDDLF